jgi:AraC family transcriptional regulator of adaptative response/methylated-DNA-[protein]-cysteine methyltransferase
MQALPDTFFDSRDFTRIARAIAFIDTHFRRQPRLAEIAAHVGLSPFHFNRLFRRWAGLTPKQYLARVTGSAAHAALAAEPSVLEAAHAVGLSGPGRLHDLVVTLDALTPGELKARAAGVPVRYGLSGSPFGTALVATTARGLMHLGFIEGSEARALAQLRSAWPGAHFERDDEHARELARRLWDPSALEQTPLRLSLTGTNFQLKVWEALLALGQGERVTYGELAARVGLAHGARAVGQAVGANPVSWLIPCHHVLRQSGALGGYRWGLERKRAMLAWESLHAPVAAAPALDNGDNAALPQKHRPGASSPAAALRNN